MPVIGEIRSFAFAEEGIKTILMPAGWLPCDGSVYDQHDYPRLHRVLGERWGSPATGKVFQVPDMRGLFVRGWSPSPQHPAKPSDGVVIGDPEAPQRVPLYPGGLNGDTVGSYQRDSVGPHRHFVKYGQRYNGGDGGGGWHYGDDVNGKNTEVNDGIESRPRNVTLLMAIYAGKKGVNSNDFVDS
jgi:hypothetical protein